ncbi:hypothetical protein scyTo_0013839 [Scyliorhinus torazame]|uniref:Kinesin motor domain-containing protein n=1 Tax=Scyliorhinus torazame TaxID=75743 RepID=A0A401P5W6_SCYTO|nr:hypothetical protein [Scyliorhinus torazame]
MWAVTSCKEQERNNRVQLDAWVGTASVPGCPVNENVPRSKSISELEECMTESVDLPGSVSDMKAKNYNLSSCAVRNTNIDEKSNQTMPPRASFMKRLGARIKQMSSFKQLTRRERNVITSNEDLFNYLSPWKKNQGKIEASSEDLMPDAKAYIPYEYARFHIAKVVDDMHQMRNKHRKLICEIKESLQATGKENQEQHIQILKKQYSDKLTIFKGALEAYQEHIKKNNKYWEEMVQNLKDENKQLIQERTVHHTQNKHEYEKWENEKTEILGGFSQKLDLLHTHQVSTLKELQMTRLELERVQEMLKSQQAIITEKEEKNCLQATSELKIPDGPDLEPQQKYSQEIQEPKINQKNFGNKFGATKSTAIEKWAMVIGPPEENEETDLCINGTEEDDQAKTRTMSSLHPEKTYMTEDSALGTNETKIKVVQVRLEKLKRTLSKKEEEMIELLKNKNKLENDFAAWTRSQIVQADTSSVVLLKRVLEKLHFVYSEVPEAQQFIDSLLNDSLGKAMAAKETLNKVQQNVKSSQGSFGRKPTDSIRDQIPEEFQSLEEAQANLWEAEMVVKALNSVRSGCISDHLNSIMAGSRKTQETRLRLHLGQEEIKQLFSADSNTIDGQGLKDDLDKRTSGVEDSASTGWTSAANKVETLQAELEHLKLENKNLVKNFNTERTLRKKYYNMVEDLKGKIRVFCRIRPLSKSELARGSQCIVHSPDEYTVTIKSSRAAKEFQFDQIFNCSTSQEEIFRDINRLIQSAVDGYNACIFAYGQTGSGKTFTMTGEKEPANLGIIPRAFMRIFQITDENQTKFSFKV